MTEGEPLPDKLTVEDAQTQALLKGHAMGTFRRDAQLGWPVATCGACGLRLFRYPDGAIAGAPLLVECPTGRAIRPPQRPGRQPVSTRFEKAPQTRPDAPGHPFSSREV